MPRGGLPLRPGRPPLLPLLAGRGRPAGRLPEPARGVLHGHPGEAHVLADLGHLGRGGRRRRRPAGPGLADRHQPGLHRAQGVRGRGAGRLRVDPGRAGGRLAHGARCAVLGGLPAARGEGRGGLHRAAAGAGHPSPGHVRHRGPEEGLSGPMRFAFKTTYDHDLGLFRDPVQRRWYAGLLAAVLLLPLGLPDYVGDVSLVFIYGLCGLSLMVLAGYTGLVRLGHAAFLGIGAYAHVYFTQDLGLPWIVSVALAAVAAAASGVLVGLPALRMTGVYLTIATLAFALIIQEVFTRWESVTHGLKGRPVDKPVI